MTRFSDRVAEWRGVRCERVQALVEYEPDSTGVAPVLDTVIEFSDGTRLLTGYWRLTKKARPVRSIFDHGLRYGLPAPIDALAVLRDELVGQGLLVAEMDQATADLRFMFDGELRLEVFNFTGFEAWELKFPDGTVEWSNYVLAD